MIPTPQQLRDTADAMEAFERGEPVECRHPALRDDVWEVTDRPSWCHDLMYRPKPNPKTRPWSKPEDVPGPVIWMRMEHAGSELLIVAIDAEGVWMWNKIYRWDYLRERNATYSTDRINWWPCEVTE
jgi:hypothetical protein